MCRRERTASWRHAASERSTAVAISANPNTSRSTKTARSSGLRRSSTGTLHRWFDALAADGRVVDPLARREWGASDGQVADRHGLHWLIGYEP